MRWRMELSCFDFDIVYRPGKENTVPDAFSRSRCSSMCGNSRSLAEIHSSLCLLLNSVAQNFGTMYNNLDMCICSCTSSFRQCFNLLKQCFDGFLKGFVSDNMRIGSSDELMIEEAFYAGDKVMHTVSLCHDACDDCDHRSLPHN